MRSHPWFGVIALATTYLAQPLSHTLASALKHTFASATPFAFLLVGIIGLAGIALAVRSDEGRATAAGFVGGLLVWVGFVDGQLSFMARLFKVPSVAMGGSFEMGGKYAILMSSVVFLVPLFFIYGLTNRESKCSLMRFIFRHSHAKPGDPTHGLRRSFARLTAMETIFVKWSVYVFGLWVYGPWANAIWGGIFVWLLYLVWKLAKFPRLGYAFRYAIPISTFFWSLTELGSANGYYTEFWLAPGEYPVTTTLAILCFVAGLFTLARRRGLVFADQPG